MAKVWFPTLSSQVNAIQLNHSSAVFCKLVRPALTDRPGNFRHAPGREPGTAIGDGQTGFLIFFFSLNFALAKFQANPRCLPLCMHGAKTGVQKRLSQHTPTHVWTSVTSQTGEHGSGLHRLQQLLCSVYVNGPTTTEKQKKSVYKPQTEKRRLISEPNNAALFTSTPTTTREPDKKQKTIVRQHYRYNTVQCTETIDSKNHFSKPQQLLSPAVCCCLLFSR